MSAARPHPDVYLDYNATSPLRPEALQAIILAFHVVGNASSIHAYGRAAADAVATAREQVARLIGCDPREIIFTSGATEANNLAIRAATPQPRGIVISAVEHPAVAEAAAAYAAAEDVPICTVGVDRNGDLRMDQLETALAARPSLVSVMAANNETGVLNDLPAIVKLAHDADAVVHTDATQLVGRLPLSLADTRVDLLSLSAHKFGGPPGVGALFVRRGAPVTVRPLAYGGGQEHGRRPGTLNVPGIVGLGAAAEAVRGNLDAELTAIAARRDRFEAAVMAAVPDTRRNGGSHRLPGVSSLTFLGVPADAVLSAMPHLAASEGSACAAGAIEPSAVLLAMGLPRDEADSTIRFSLGYATTDSDIDTAIASVIEAVVRVRSALADSR